MVLRNFVFVLGFMILQFSITICDPSEPDKMLYNPDITETGPFSQELFDSHPRMAYLGKINEKNYYIERIRRTQGAARNKCRAMGMQLARFDSQAELNFISTKTSSADDFAWTDGRNRRINEAFIWDATHLDPNSVLKGGLTLEYPHYVGLTLSRQIAPSNTKLRATNFATTNYYLYYL